MNNNRSHEEIIQEAIDIFLQKLVAAGFGETDILNEVEIRLSSSNLNQFKSKLNALDALLKGATSRSVVRQLLGLKLNINEDPESNYESNNGNPGLPNSNQEGGRRKRKTKKNRKTRKLKKKLRRSRRK